ncbi:MAG: hypothetical protein ACR2PU_02100 [Gammaproteobacteria bacterium]
MPTHKISEQVRRNAVAIISLIVAVTSLAYNTYRNELTEENRTVRQAGFEMISELSQLQQYMLVSRYGETDNKEDTTVGWSHVLTIRDLSLAMPENIHQQAEQLYEVWQQNHEQISASDESAYKMIDEKIDTTKTKILDEIKRLD